MAKKETSGGMCSMCHCDPCKCAGMGWFKALCGLVTAVLGLLMIWPKGWFTFEHSLGLLVFLFGLHMLWWGFKSH
ncbi:hypothetical protein J4230_03035 [Candidatus Woesearchaeota archaeon]|nr:hypothetical protein [Candidatus Woesearchaeota archaeon]